MVWKCSFLLLIIHFYSVYSLGISGKLDFDSDSSGSSTAVPDSDSAFSGISKTVVEVHHTHKDSNSGFSSSKYGQTQDRVFNIGKIDLTDENNNQNSNRGFVSSSNQGQTQDRVFNIGKIDLSEDSNKNVASNQGHVQDRSFNIGKIDLSDTTNKNTRIEESGRKITSTKSDTLQTDVHVKVITNVHKTETINLNKQNSNEDDVPIFQGGTLVQTQNKNIKQNVDNSDVPIFTTDNRNTNVNNYNSNRPTDIPVFSRRNGHNNYNSNRHAGVSRNNGDVPVFSRGNIQNTYSNIGVTSRSRSDTGRVNFETSPHVGTTYRTADTGRINFDSSPQVGTTYNTEIHRPIVAQSYVQNRPSVSTKTSDDFNTEQRSFQDNSGRNVGFSGNGDSNTFFSSVRSRTDFVSEYGSTTPSIDDSNNSIYEFKMPYFETIFHNHYFGESPPPQSMLISNYNTNPHNPKVFQRPSMKPRPKFAQFFLANQGTGSRSGDDSVQPASGYGYISGNKKCFCQQEGGFSSASALALVIDKGNSNGGNSDLKGSVVKRVDGKLDKLD